ncbi:MAG: TIGR00730 family Rossman fold protein [Chloroflexi bacterium]|nr:LOG family protein YvdD [Anaerolineales bacterium]MCE7919851.1 TIGR00730 family Rossman fold protein [Chloroflexi bacterium CFX1]MCQ3952252.1 TIGR00730 family Rossman fold protein [Chloroflexota bacterium]MDL1918539.1 TIGR00730 family Rossman fold protein [Chloroflexi bacterium CFX5]MCK6566618.1 TIGR00730 family Rossman fold protein [Anaerolineales bacterium]
MKSICVFCGSSDAVADEYKKAAFQTGAVLARNGIRLIYGGGKTGLMGQVADGSLSAGGETVGITIPSMNTVALGHTSLTRLETVPDMHARKARMHELSDGYIALPGGFGTLDELFETIAWAQTGAHEKPVGLLNTKNYYAPLLAVMDHAVAEGFVFPEHRRAIALETDPLKLLESMRDYEHPREAVRRWMKEE